MARDWHYTIPNSLYRAPPPIFLLACASCYCSFLFVVFVLFFFVFFHASLWSFVDVPLHLFPVQQTTYRIGNHVYYWVLVWLRPDRLIII